MLSKIHFPLLAITCFVLIASPVIGQALPVNMISISAEGRLTARSEATLNAILGRATAPSHIYIMSHGWNNTYDDAVHSYARILTHMDAVANQYGLRPRNYDPLVIGIYWPSKSGADLSANRSVDEDFRIIDARDVLDPTKSPSTWAMDVASMNEILALPPSDLTNDDYAFMKTVIERYKLAPNDGEGEGGDVFAFDGNRGADLSPGDIFGLLSFWNKKELAGIVGKNGVSSVIKRLQQKFGNSQYHLFGHSFGAKVVLAAVTSGSDIRPVNSIVLIQPAISCLALSPAGGYEKALDKVTGPIVATYSDLDRALALPYRAASRLAGQRSEVDRSAAVSGYSAMGSIGPDPTRFRTTSMVATSSSNMYTWTSHVPVGVDSTNYITGHSEFYNPQTARMIWSVVQACQPIDGSTRSVTENQLSAVMKASLLMSKTSVKDNSPKDFIQSYSDALIKGLSSGKTHFNELDSSRSLGLSFDLQDKQFDTKSVFGDLQKSIVGRDLNSAKNLQMIIEGNPQFPEIVSNLIDPVGNPIVKDGSEQQCVCIGYTEKTGSRVNWIGTGCVVQNDSGRQFVLTAAHVRPKFLSIEDVDFCVLVGDCFSDPSSSKKLKVIKRVEHPSYDSDKHLNDIAVLILERDVTKEELNNGQPYKIADVDVIEQRNGQVVNLVGFGSTTGMMGMAHDGFKRRLALPLTPLEYSETFANDNGINNGLEFVAGKLGMNADSCWGDSGGPAYVKVNNQKFLVGCIVRGIKLRCGDGSIEVRTAKYKDFIEKALKE
jgi:hypothetical protein